MFHYTVQIVPNSSNYDTSPGNVHKGYKMLGNVPLHFSNYTKFIELCYLSQNVHKGYKMLGNVPLHLFKLYQTHQIMLLIPEMYIKDTKC